MVSLVVDLGNSRLKWARVGPHGTLLDRVALPLDQPAVWAATLEQWVKPGQASRWAISTVNPPVAERLKAFLARRQVGEVHWLTSAADVPVEHELALPETAGADRALAVLGALGLHQTGPGIVVSCGSAIVVERISPEGVWQGGAIAPGLGLSARALHLFTAQLPLIAIGATPPRPWGGATEPALAAGVFWGAVGAVRELIGRQSQGWSTRPWVIWSGGDAEQLAPWVADERTQIVPDLVLSGLARVEQEATAARTSP